MLQNFLVAVNAVVPFLCYLALGWGARKMGAVDVPFLNKLTKLVFAVMFPFMTFNNIYAADPGNTPSPSLLVFVGSGILLLEGMMLALVPRLVKENPRRGVIIQAMYRSNFVLFGLPLTVTIFGEEKASIVAMLVTLVLTIYNSTSVVILELFNDGGDPSHRVTAGDLLSRLVRNPMLQGCALGLAFYCLRLRLPGCIANPVANIANMTTPLAMFALGGTLRFEAIAKNLRYLAPVLVGKLVIIPLVLVPLAYAIGLRGVELFLVLAVFGTPVASGSYPMAMNMGGDGELAGQLVFVSTVASIFTLFVWIFCMGNMGLLV